jgi:hypothetical protein
VRVPAVRPGGEQRRDRLDAHLPQRAAVADDAAADGGQLAGAGRAKLEVDQLAGRRVGRGEVLGAAEDEPHRPAERERRGRDQRLGDHQLAAERAAERRGLHAHLVG